MVTIEETVTPEGLRARAEMVGNMLDDSGSCARHLVLAADRIAELEAELAQTQAGADHNGAIADLSLAMLEATPVEEKYAGYTLLEAAKKAVDRGTLGAWEWFQAWFNAELDDDDPEMEQW